MNIKAWESEQARDTAGNYSTPYKDRPVAKSSWKKVSDTPVKGLAVYQIPPESPSKNRPDDVSTEENPDDKNLFRRG